ncbi:MAG: ferrous iron transporter B, partial [Candidatus Omnitrophica bacterium]|nr:ferrous iron transporter B [Candidatus Omnitrophota bacterium]
MRSDYRGPIEYSIEIAIERIENLLAVDYSVSKRTIALLLLQDDEEIKAIVAKREPSKMAEIEKVVEDEKAHSGNPINYVIALERQSEVNQIISKVVSTKKRPLPFSERVSRLMMNPITGLPILFAVLYLGLYKFVGQFGAGKVVDFLEGAIFEERINPYIIDIFNNIVPWIAIRELVVGEYGIITLGFRYAVALI